MTSQTCCSLGCDAVYFGRYYKRFGDPPAANNFDDLIARKVVTSLYM